MNNIPTLVTNSGLYPSAEIAPEDSQVETGKVLQLIALFNSTCTQEDEQTPPSRDVQKRKIRKSPSFKTNNPAERIFSDSKLPIKPLDLSGMEEYRKNKRRTLSSSDNHRFVKSPAKKEEKKVKSEKDLIKRLKKLGKKDLSGAINVEFLKDFAFETCRSHAKQELRQSASTINLEDFVRNIQKSGMILSPIIRRLQVFHTAIKDFIDDNEYTSENVDSVSQLLDLLINGSFQDSLAVSGFNKSKKIIKILNKAFGSTKEERREVVKYLNDLLNPCGEFLGTLPGHVDQTLDYSVTASNLLAREHKWSESSNAEHSIYSVIPYEIIRCLHNGMGIPMNSLIINGEELYNYKWEESDDEVEYLPPEQWQFFSEVVQKIMSCQGYSISEEFLSENVDLFRELSAHSWETRSEIAYPPEKNQWLNVLRGMSNSSWAKADDYIRALFPGLFFQPYWCRQIQGIDLNLEINGPENFFVTHRRTYAVYNRVKPTSTTVERDKPLCSIDFSWKVSLNQGCWEGTLTIEDFHMYDDGKSDMNIFNLHETLQQSYKQARGNSTLPQ